MSGGVVVNALSRGGLAMMLFSGSYVCNFVQLVYTNTTHHHHKREM